MILWLFALFDFFFGLVLIGIHYDILPWRMAIGAAMALGIKAFVFNDRFLSFIDIMAALYMLYSLFFSSTVLTWVFAAYFAYKVLMSLL